MNASFAVCVCVCVHVCTHTCANERVCGRADLEWQEVNKRRIRRTLATSQAKADSSKWSKSGLKIKADAQRNCKFSESLGREVGGQSWRQNKDWSEEVQVRGSRPAEISGTGRDETELSLQENGLARWSWEVSFSLRVGIRGRASIHTVPVSWASGRAQECCEQRT